MMMFTTGILESNALLHWSCDISNEYIYEYKVDAYVFLFRLIDFWYHFFFWLWTEAPFVVSFFSRLCWWFELACCLHAWAGFEVSAFTCSKLIIENNARTMCETCSNLTIKIPERRLVIKIRERRHWRCSGVFIVNFEHISHLVLVFLLLTLNM